MLFATLSILTIILKSDASNLHNNVTNCFARDLNCAVLYCDDGGKYGDPEILKGKNDEIHFVRASGFPNDSSTGKFIGDLASKNDSIRRKVLSEKQLSHLMEHKVKFTVNGIWFEHNAKDSLFPIVSIRNSTENELEVLYLDCSLADINLQFLDVFGFTSRVIFWLYVVEGFGLTILFVLFMSKEDLDAKDAGTDNDDIGFALLLSLGFSHLASILYFWSPFAAIYFNFFTNLILISMLLCM
jgi:hypothetical protein